jgi:hypothetical protein
MHKIVDDQFTWATLRCLFIKFPLVSSKLAVQLNVAPFGGTDPKEYSVAVDSPLPVRR